MQKGMRSRNRRMRT